MKRTTWITLLILLLMTISKAAFGATTFLMGASIDGDDKINDYTNITGKPIYSGNLDTTLLSLTYINTVKIVLTKQFGEYLGEPQNRHMEIFDIQAGYPLSNKKDGLFYLTIGGLDYTGFKNGSIYLHEADGGLLGFEMVGIPSNKIFFELGFQHSIDGSYRINMYDSSMNLTIFKLKVQYILTDNLGLAVYFRNLDFDTKHTFQEFSEQLKTTWLGVIYRL